MEFQVNGKDGAIDPFEVVESPERKDTLKHLVKRALIVNPRCLAKATQASLQAVQPESGPSGSFFSSETWEKPEGQFRNLTAYNPNFSYKWRCTDIRVKQEKKTSINYITVSTIVKSDYEDSLLPCNLSDK